jgi:hypothetical protein
MHMEGASGAAWDPQIPRPHPVHAVAAAFGQ